MSTGRDPGPSAQCKVLNPGPFSDVLTWPQTQHTFWKFRNTELNLTSANRWGINRVFDRKHIQVQHRKKAFKQHTVTWGSWPQGGTCSSSRMSWPEYRGSQFSAHRNNSSPELSVWPLKQVGRGRRRKTNKQNPAIGVYTEVRSEVMWWVPQETGNILSEMPVSFVQNN